MFTSTNPEVFNPEAVAAANAAIPGMLAYMRKTMSETATVHGSRSAQLSLESFVTIETVSAEDFSTIFPTATMFTEA